MYKNVGHFGPTQR